MNTNKRVDTNLSPESMDLTNESIDKILRGEYSAIESYNQVMEKVDKDPEIARLRKFKADHKKAADFWRSQIRRQGKVPAKSSGVWGTVVEAFVGTSKLIGNSTALKAIKDGEEHGLKLYEYMLKSEELSPSQKAKIKQEFIPNQMQHIETINAITKLQ